MGHQDLQDLRVTPEPQELLVLKEMLEAPELWDPPDLRETLAHPDPQEPPELTDPWDPPDFKEPRETRDVPVCREIPAPAVSVERMESRDTWA